MTTVAKDRWYEPTVVQGEQWQLEVYHEVNEGTDEEPDWQPQDVTGWEARLRIAEQYGQTPLVEITEVLSAQGQIEITGDEGLFYVVVDESVTVLLDGDCVFDLFIFPDPDTPTLLLQGVIRLRKGV